MSKLFKICIACVVVVWLFALGLVVGTFTVRKEAQRIYGTERPNDHYDFGVSESASTTQININMVTNETVTAKEEVPSSDFSIPTANSSLSTYESVSNATSDVTLNTAPDSTSNAAPDTTNGINIPSGNKEIAEALVKAINDTKAMQDFSASKTENLSVGIDKITGGAIVKSIADGVVSKQSNKPDTNCNFNGGVDQNGTGKTPNSLIAPIDGMAYLDESAIKTASATQNASGGYTITLEINEETQSLESNAKNHDGLFETITVESLGLPSNLSISALNITYSGAKIVADINKDGKLDKIQYTLPVKEAGGEGKFATVNVNVKLHGQYDCTINFTY